MSRKVRNLFFAGKTVQISSEKVTFDKDGIGVIESDELAAQVVNLKGYDDPEPMKSDIDENDKSDGDGQDEDTGAGEGNSDGDGSGEGAQDVDDTDDTGTDDVDAQDNADDAGQQTSETVQQPIVPQTPVRQPAAVKRTPPKSSK